MHRPDYAAHRSPFAARSSGSILEQGEPMKTKILKATEIGFCFGVRRAIEMLEVAVQQDGKLEPLGSVVHNEQVMERLSKIGIGVINSPDQIKCSVVSISAHGVSPQVEA